jgi:hypothetical protein
MFLSHLSYWRPLATASYALDLWRAGGVDLGALHATNFALHSLAVLLTFVLLRAFAFSPLASALGAMASAWHPVKAESVAWISGRTDVLFYVGVVLVLLADRMWRTKRFVAGALALVGLAVSFCSKETAIVLPLVLLGGRAIAEARGLDEPSVAESPWASLLAFLRANRHMIALFASVSAAYLLLRQRLMPIKPGAVAGLSLARHAGLVGETIGRYVEATILPYDVTMMRSAVRSPGGLDEVSWRFAAFGVLVVVGLAVGLHRGHRHRVALGLMLLFFAPILPVLNLVPMGMMTTVSVRFLYASFLAVAIAVAQFVESAPISGLRGVVMLALGALGISTAGRASAFASVDTFWDEEALSRPDSPMVHQALFTRY